MKLFVNTNHVLETHMVEISPSETVGQLMKHAFPDMKKNSDFEEDNEVYLQNQDEDLDKGKRLEEYDIKNGDTLFVGKCKRVRVLVIYMGKSYSLDTTPALTLRNLRKKVSSHFGMNDEEVSEFQFLDGDKPIDNLKIMVGSLTSYSACSVSLTFAPKKDINGFV